MQDKLHRLHGLLLGCRTALEGAFVPAYQEEFERVHWDLDQITQKTHLFLSIYKHRSVKEILRAREVIAGVRTKLYRLIKQVEEIQTQVAEDYRRLLGEQKNWFESLSPAEQQHYDAQAYYFKAVFWSMRQLEANLGEINGLLLDFSGAFGQELNSLRNTPPAPATEVESFDQSPTRLGLSP